MNSWEQAQKQSPVTTFFHSKKFKTVEGLVSDNLGNSKKEVVTRAGHLWEWAPVSNCMVKQ